MNTNEFIQDSHDFIFNEITKTKIKEPRWYCDECDKKVNGIEHTYPRANGADDVEIGGEVVCAECGNVLWED